MTHKLILIGGLPGVGKTYIARMLARSLDCPHIDKDITTGRLTGRLLEALGSVASDRESSLYMSKVRGVEYEALMDCAMDALDLHDTVLCSAPFISEFSDAQWVAAMRFTSDILGSEIIRLWVWAPEDIAHKRLIARDAMRDTWKLANWSRYTTSVSHARPRTESGLIVIDNSPRPDKPIGVQVARAVETICPPRTPQASLAQ